MDQPGANNNRKKSKSERAPNGLPNALIDDPSIDEDALCLAAYKAWRGPRFVLNQKDVQKRFGIGPDRFQAAIRKLKASGRYERDQPRRGRSKQFARDGFAADQPGRPGYLIVRSEWFSLFEVVQDPQPRSALVKALGVFIFMHSQKASLTVERWRIKKRFDLTPPTVKKRLDVLEKYNLVRRLEAERKSGQFVPHEFTAHPLNAAMSNSPATLWPATVCPGAHLNEVFIKTKRNSKGSYEIAPNQSEQPGFRPSTAGGSRVRPEEFDPDSWIDTNTYFDLRDASEFKKAASVPFDAAMKEHLKSTNALRRLEAAVEKRIHPKLLTRVGIKGFVTLIHWVKQRDGSLTVEEAIDRVIEVAARVMEKVRRAKKGKSLNGWALVGIELDKNGLQSRDQPSASHGVSQGRVANTESAGDLIERISAVDYNHVLSKRLRSDRQGLCALVEEYGEDIVEEVICRKLNDFSINGPPEKPPGSWAYFKPIIEDEIKRAAMTEDGVRPGDLMGDWRNKPLTAADIPF